MFFLIGKLICRQFSGCLRRLIVNGQLEPLDVEDDNHSSQVGPLETALQLLHIHLTFSSTHGYSRGLPSYRISVLLKKRER